MTDYWHPPTPSTVNDRGDETHPAFGFIQASRVTSYPGQVLFDSDIKHTNTVMVRIGKMSRKRDHTHDWLHPNQELIEVELSEAQWASFVSSMNTQGVPCTIRRTEDDLNVPGIEYSPRLKLSHREAQVAARTAFADIEQAMAEYEALDSKAPVKERRAALATLRAKINNAAPNVEFASKMLIEHTENVVQRARADIEAMASQHAQHIEIEGSFESPAIEVEETVHGDD